jgi:NADH-quinone oxidoreductase subunit G
MPFVKINEQELEVPNGQTIIEAAKSIGIAIPFYCYHPGLKIVASCRMCLVEMQGAPKLVPACATPITELPPGKKIQDKYDAIILTESQKVKIARASILEFLLLNHPIDCPICDKAGECKLQDYSYEHGYKISRFIEPKRIPQKKDLGPTIYLYTSRCILCSRCVRFTEEISGTEELKVIHRGSHSEIDIMPGKPLDNKLMGNVVDICPVGCLIDKHERFEGRVWNFTHTNSICPGCSKGCNTILDVMKHDKLNLEDLVDTVYRIRPRDNIAVNQYWICDDGRYYLETYKNRKRISVPHAKNIGQLEERSWDQVILKFRDLLKSAPPENVLLVGSPYASNEENYLLLKLAQANQYKTDLIKPETGETQTFQTAQNKYPFTIENEKAPNYHGALQIFNIPEERAGKQIEPGCVKVIVFLNERNMPDTDKLRSDNPHIEIIVLSTHEWTGFKDADMVLPSAMFTETSGTYMNKDGLVQKFDRAIFPDGEIKPSWQILQNLARALELKWNYDTIGHVAKEMFEAITVFQNSDFSKVYPQLAERDMIL